MNPLKTLTLSLTIAGMMSAFALPAMADGRRDNNRQYTTQNHKGYANPNYNGRGHDDRSRGNSDNRRYDNNRRNNQSYNNRGNTNRNYNNRGYNNNRYYQPAPRTNYNHYKPRYSYNPYQRVVYAPQFRNNGRYHPRYQVGARFSGYNRFLISDYQRYGLYNPPRGHYWVRQDNDAYLAAAGTGLIAGVIIGALASGY